MDLSIIEQEVIYNAQNLTEEFQRLFHGRGGLWEEWRFLTIDSIDHILLIQFFYDAPQEIQQAVINFAKKFIQTSRHNTIIVKHRYIRGCKNEIICGEVTENEIAIENKMKFAINLLQNQNIGYFGDMKNGRSFIENISKGKKVLNLFSYTCGFSLFAKRGGATEVVNVDMAKRALAIGMKNHALNNITPQGISFLPYNILRSFPKLIRKAPFDIIIIDPPTFQKGSFEATTDYQKIIQKLPQLAGENATILACLNSPDLKEDFLIQQFEELSSGFKFQKRLPNLPSYKSLDEQRSLKNLVFQKENEV